MTSRVFCCQQVDDVPPYITVPPYTTTVWGVSAPEAFYPKNSVAQQADVSQPYGGGEFYFYFRMGNWIDVFFSLRFARDGRLVQRGVLHVRQTVRVYDYNLLSLFLSLYGRVD